MKAQNRNPAYKPPKRFMVGAHVRVKNPGLDGFVTHVADERTTLSEYWHKVNTKYGERKEPGCNLELIPPPIGLPASPRPVKLADNIHFHGPNARLNVDSIDQSTNTVLISKDRVFVQLREQASSIDDAQERAEIFTRIEALENTHGTENFLAAYQAFMASASNHITVFTMLLPALAQMLSGGS
jgi:hypothetical protein